MNNADTLRKQAGSTTLYLALTILVLVGVGIAVYLLSKNDQADDAAALPQQDAPLMDSEPPAIKPVDMQDSQIETDRANKHSDAMDGEDSEDGNGLFERGGKKIPLEDGLAGGSEATTEASSSTATAGRKVHALDAFDYGVLDGRVRIGVFGKGPIPDYRVSLKQTDYVIDMPGEFRYLDQFRKALIIQQVGVNKAWLERTSRGMRMRIEVTAGLQHEPFLIEDSKGLIIAFEPRR